MKEFDFFLSFEYLFVVTFIVRILRFWCLQHHHVMLNDLGKVSLSTLRVLELVCFISKKKADCYFIFIIKWKNSSSLGTSFIKKFADLCTWLFVSQFFYIFQYGLWYHFKIYFANLNCVQLTLQESAFTVMTFFIKSAALLDFVEISICFMLEWVISASWNMLIIE